VEVAPKRLAFLPRKMPSLVFKASKVKEKLQCMRILELAYHSY